MSDNPFDTNEEIQKIIDAVSLLTNGIEAAEKTLAQAAAFDDAARTYIADRLEERLRDNLQDVMNAEPEEVQSMVTHMLSTNEESESLMLMSQVVAFIVDTKGDNLLPLIKTYVKEAAKLSDEEYAQPENHGQIWVNMAKQKLDAATLVPRPPKTNPFRGRNPGL